MVPSVIPLITITTRTIHCDSAFSGHNTCSNISIIAHVCPAAQAATKALCETAAPGFFAARTVDIDGISTIPKGPRLQGRRGNWPYVRSAWKLSCAACIAWTFSAWFVAGYVKCHALCSQCMRTMTTVGLRRTTTCCDSRFTKPRSGP